MKDKIKINTLDQLLDFVETEEKANLLIYYINYLQHIEDLYNQLLKDYDELLQENERLKQNQVKVLNRIRDFIHSSKCEITEGSYCDNKHSQYWTMFKEFAEELQDKIKGFDTKDYVYILKWREQELLSQEEQLKDYKSRIEKAVEYIKADYINGLVDGLSWLEVQILVKILNGRSDE